MEPAAAGETLDPSGLIQLSPFVIPSHVRPNVMAR
jgi:hypothetical protein